MRTRSCNVVRATLVACGTIGLLASLATAQQAQKPDPVNQKNPAALKKALLGQTNLKQTQDQHAGKGTNGPSLGTERPLVPTNSRPHAAGGGVVVRGPGAAGDLCGSAPIVAEGTYGFDSSSWSEGVDIDTCAFGNNLDGWWHFRPLATGTATVTACTGSGSDTVFSAFDACGGAQIACDDDACCFVCPSAISFPVVAGGDYWVRVTGYADDPVSGTADFTVSPPATNENCDPGNPALTLDTPDFANNTGAATDVTVDGACSFGGAPTLNDLFWKFTAPADSAYRFSTCGSTLDSNVAVFSGCPADQFSNLLGCNDDSCGGSLQSQVDVTLTTGQLVYVRVAGWNGAQGAFQIQVTLPPPPADCAVCPPLAIDENEPDCGIAGGTDTVNGGCNSPSPVFTAISIGQTACGTGAFDGSFRDTDWYEFTLVSGTQVTWTVTAEFPVLVGLIAAPCPATAFIPGTPFEAGACTQVLSTACLPAGTYYAFVAPQFTDTFACGSGAGNRYTAALTGTPCTPIVPDNDDCTGVEVLTLGVVAFGDNTGGNTTTTMTSCSFGGAPTGPDVFYSFTPVASDNYIVNTCGSFLDTTLSVFLSCPGDEFSDMVGCNDDFCGLQSQTTVAMSAGTTYTIRMGGWNGAQGAFQILVDVAPPPATCGECPPGPVVLENEPDCGIAGGTDTVNGGCNSAPEVFTSISLGQTACGTGAFDGSFRDTDWYEFNLVADTQVTWTVTAEFDLLIGLINSPCPATAFIVGTPQTSTEPCITLTSTACLPAGTYYAFVAPQFTETFACGTGAGNRYTATLSGVSCTPPTPPGNDLCPGDVVTAPSSTPGTTIAATNSSATCLGSAPDVFYSFTPPVSGTYTIDLCGSAYDTSLAVYTDCSFATTVACNDDSCGLQSSLTLSLTGGTVHIIRVGGFAAQSGTFTLNISAPPAAPTGACCVGGNCSVITAAACASAFGTYLGNNASCSSGTFTSNPALAIPDNGCPATVSDTQVIAPAATITAMTVRVQIPNHTFIGDLNIRLTNGITTVQLWNLQCTFNDGMDVTFADGAPAVVCGQPTVGTFAPAAPLSAFNGASTAGNWSLVLCDDVGADIGTLTSWSLSFTAAGLPSACGPAFCDADWCQDGIVGVPDIFCFLADWFANDPTARNYGGTNGVPAIFAFLSVWFAEGTGPCP